MNINVRDLTIFKAYVEHLGYRYEDNKVIKKGCWPFNQDYYFLEFRPKSNVLYAYCYGMPVTAQEICKAFTEITYLELSIEFCSDDPLRYWNHFMGYC